MTESQIKVKECYYTCTIALRSTCRKASSGVIFPWAARTYRERGMITLKPHDSANRFQAVTSAITTLPTPPTK